MAGQQSNPSNVLFCNLPSRRGRVFVDSCHQVVYANNSNPNCAKVELLNSNVGTHSSAEEAMSWRGGNQLHSCIQLHARAEEDAFSWTAAYSWIAACSWSAWWAPPDWRTTWGSSQERHIDQSTRANSLFGFVAFFPLLHIMLHKNGGAAKPSLQFSLFDTYPFWGGLYFCRYLSSKSVANILITI